MRGAAAEGVSQTAASPRPAETSDETRTDFLRRMRKETERIHVVVRDLLDYARPEDDGPHSQFSQKSGVVDLSALPSTRHLF